LYEWKKVIKLKLKFVHNLFVEIQNILQEEKTS